MAYVKYQERLKIGDRVILIEVKDSMAGYFEKGTEVEVVEIDTQRGYGFMDKCGNRVIETGWDGFKIKD